LENSDVRKGIPVYIDDREPEIDDPLSSSESHYWYPANSISIKLMACLEAMRDIHKFLEMLSRDNNATDKRIHKLLTTPVFSLAGGVEKLFNDIEGNAKEYGQITAKQQREIKKRFIPSRV
jgi:hypothetical protein